MRGWAHRLGTGILDSTDPTCMSSRPTQSSKPAGIARMIGADLGPVDLYHESGSYPEARSKTNVPLPHCRGVGPGTRTRESGPSQLRRDQFSSTNFKFQRRQLVKTNPHVGPSRSELIPAGRTITSATWKPARRNVYLWQLKGVLYSYSTARTHLRRSRKASYLIR